MRKFIAILTLSVVAFLVENAVGEEWSPRPGSWIEIAGTSTLHDWEVRSTEIDGSVSFPANFFETDGEGVEAFVIIPAKSLESHSGRMDRVMLEALEAEENPNVEFILTGAVPISKSSATVTGDLIVAGVERQIEMTVVMTRSGEQIIFTGSIEIDMTDWRIDPPTAMFGTIRTGPEVTVSFQWQLGRR